MKTKHLNKIKQRILLLTLFIINFSGYSGGFNGCFTCIDNLPDSMRMRQIMESVSAPLIDSFTKYLRDQVYEAKMIQDSAAYIVDSVWNEQNKKKIVSRIDIWPTPSGYKNVVKWLYWIYPNGEIRYYDVDHKTYRIN